MEVPLRVLGPAAPEPQQDLLSSATESCGCKGVGVSKVSGFFVHNQQEVRYSEKCTRQIREEAVSEPLCADQEVRAQALLPLLRQAVDDELLALARLLAGAD